MIETIKDLARRAGEIIYGAKAERLSVKTKSGASDFVTAYDVAVQNFLREELKKAFPSAAFMGEEQEDHTVGGGPTFIIDPIDGTTNFIRGLGHSCVSIGYYEGKEAVHGVVYNPYDDEMFYATRGQGAFLAQHGSVRPVKRGDCTLAESLVVVGTSPYCKKATGEETMRVFRELLYRSLDLRRSGSAALDLCYTADGRYDLFFEHIISPWDFAAGQLIVKEAGGVITDPYGKDMPLTPSAVLAGAPTACLEYRKDIGFFG